MENSILIKDLKKLSVAERIELVEDLWDTIAESPEMVETTEEQKQLLDKRLQAHARKPEEGSPWEEVKKRIRGKK